MPDMNQPGAPPYNVINLGEYRFTKANTRSMWKTKDCQHLHLTLDAHGEVVTCDDCSKQVGAFWARRHNSAPVCPHCRVAILPEDGFGQCGSTNKEMEVARRKRAASNGEATQ